jgi:multiple sugar transport system ATP-binding protein
MSMGDRIAVMKNGKILQVDHPTKVYDLPSDHFVGSFIGNPPMNFLHGQVQRDDGVYKVKIGDYTLTPPQEMQSAFARYDGKEIYVGIRAEVMEALLEAAPDTLPVTVEVVEPLGAQNLLTTRVGNDVLKISTHPDFPARMGDHISLRFPIQKVRYMDVDTGKAITPDIQAVAAV